MTGQGARDDEREALIAEAQEYLDIECNMSRYPILVDKLLTALREAIQEPARKHPEPKITDARLKTALEAAWDGGNASGLDGWVGPGRGTEPIDDVAVYQRGRDVEAILRAWVPAGEGEQ